MRCCTTITLKKLPTGIPSLYISSGIARLDVSGELQTVEQVAEGSDLGFIKQSGSYSMSFPLTKRNIWIFDYYAKGAGRWDDIEVIVTVDGIEMPEDVLRLRRVSGCDTVEGDLIRMSGWQEKTKQLRTYQVQDFEPFLWGETHVFDNQTNDQEYTGTQRGYYMPHVQYGAHWNSWARNQGYQVWSIENARIMPHVRALLEKGFCQLGYKFKCEFLESDLGVRIGAYLCNNGFEFPDRLTTIEKDKQFLEEVFIENQCYPAYDYYKWGATKTADQVLVHTGGTNIPVVKFEQEDYDSAESLAWNTLSGAGNGFWRDSAIFAGYMGKWRFSGKLIISAAAAFTGKICFSDGYYNAGAGTLLPFMSGTQLIKRSALIEVNYTTPGVEVEYEFDVDFVGVASTDQECCMVDSAQVANTYTVHAGSYVRAKCEYISPTQRESLFAFLSPSWQSDTKCVVFPQSYFGDHSFLDFVSGISHLISGKIDHNEVSGRIDILPTVETNFNGEVINGFVSYSGAEPIDNSLVCCSQSVSQDRYDPPCRINIKFKDSTDAYINAQFPDKLSHPWQKIIQTGNNNCLGDNSSSNPFFEPTIERRQKELSNSGVYMPVMADNMDFMVSYNIAPRLLVFLGYGNHSGFGVYRRYFGLAETLTPLLAYASQSQVIPFAVPPVGQPLTRPDFDLVYGGGIGDGDELYLFWKSTHSASSRVIAQVTAYTGGIVNFLAQSFRKIYYLGVGSRTLKMRLTKKGAYSCQGKTTLYEYEELPDCEG